MATTRLSDVYIVHIWKDIEAEMDPKKTLLYESGIIASDGEFDAMCAAPGWTGTADYWRDLDHTIEPNYGTDSDTRSTPNKVIQDTMTWRKVHPNQSWAVKNLTRRIQTNTDALQHVKNRTGKYWTYYWQDRLISHVIGLVLSNIAGRFSPQIAARSTAGDMVHDISIANANAATAVNRFNRDAFIETVYTMGDREDELGAMVVHSVVSKTIAKLEDTSFILDSETNTRIMVYMGRIVIVSDATPVYEATPGTPANGYKYVSAVYGQQSFMYGTCPAQRPVATDFDESTGDGAGEEILYERKAWLTHPLGFKNDNNVVSVGINNDGVAQQQNLEDLQDATNWTRTHLRKNIPLGFMVSNG